MRRLHPWEWVFIAVCAVFAAYVAAEPVLAADDCISIGEILVLLPYYVLLYFGTLPALIWFVIRRGSHVTTGILCVLLFLEAAAYFPSNYSAVANRALDFVPAAILVLWLTRTWLCARAPRDVRS